jgi:hypothetical protein
MLTFCRIPMTLSNGNIHQLCMGPNCMRKGSMWRAVWWFSWNWMLGYNSNRSHRYATIFSSNNCEWCSNIWYDVCQHTAMAGCIVLWKNLSQRAKTSWSWPGGQISLDQSCTTETGMSNLIHIFIDLLSAFYVQNFPNIEAAHDGMEVGWCYQYLSAVALAPA